MGSSSTISDKVFIGEDVAIGARTLIRPQVKIWPKKTIANDTILATSLVWGDKWLRGLFTDARISGIANIEIKPDFASRLGSALGAFWGQGASIYSSCDSNAASFMVTTALQSGLISMGIQVDNLHTTPIPVVRQILKKSRKLGGFHVRKSPYDERKTDIIVFDTNGTDLHTNKCKKVERLFFGEDYERIEASSVGFVEETVRLFDMYQKNFIANLDTSLLQQANMHAVIDFSYGPGSTIFPSLFGDLNIDIVTLSAFSESLYRSFSRKQHRQQVNRISKIVKSLRADVGFIIDPTCERLYLVDNKGRYFENLELLAIVTQLYLNNFKPKKISAPVLAPRLIQTMARKHRVGYKTCKSTHRSMIEVALDEDIGFVGGTLGGFIFPEFNTGADAMFSTVKILEMLARMKEPLSKFIDSIQFPSIARANIACSWEQKGKVMNALMKATDGMKRELIHGIKIYNEDTWTVFLPARAEALFSVTSEAPTQKAAEILVKTWAKKIRSWRDRKI